MSSSETYDERPSLHSITTSPSRRYSEKVSTATSGSAPSARVITLRCGWCSASSG